MKKAAAEASMQRSKKARIVELFFVRYHVMCPFLFAACVLRWFLVPSYVSAKSAIRTYVASKPKCGRTHSQRLIANR